VYHGGEIFLEFSGDTGGSNQICQSQSAEVGDGILVHETVPQSSGNAKGSGENCGSQSELNPDCKGGPRILDGKSQYLFFHC
jgi:hypothetical protein